MAVRDELRTQLLHPLCYGLLADVPLLRDEGQCLLLQHLDLET